MLNNEEGLKKVTWSYWNKGRLQLLSKEVLK